MTDIEQIYNILLAQHYQEELFSMPTKRTEKGGRELVKDCPFCDKRLTSMYRLRGLTIIALPVMPLETG
jgi:hypothetical protein